MPKCQHLKRILDPWEDFDLLWFDLVTSFTVFLVHSPKRFNENHRYPRMIQYETFPDRNITVSCGGWSGVNHACVSICKHLLGGFTGYAVRPLKKCKKIKLVFVCSFRPIHVDCYGFQNIFWFWHSQRCLPITPKKILPSSAKKPLNHLCFRRKCRACCHYLALVVRQTSIAQWPSLGWHNAP